MAKQIKSKNTNKKIVSKNVKKPAASLPKEHFWGLEKILEKNQTKVIFIFLFVSLIFSFLLFDIRISEGGDDSAYIQRGWDFIKKNVFPFYQGPLYPLVLAIPLYFFGINLFILKLLSVIFALGTIWFTYLAFRKRIPYLVLFSLLLFLSINSYIQYYASQTYTESFFLFLQAISLYFVMKIIDSMPLHEAGSRKREAAFHLPSSIFQFPVSNFLWIGICFTLLTLAKSIAIVCIVPVILFFLFYRNYRYALFTFLSFTICKVLVELVIRTFYQDAPGGRFQQIFLKDFYKPELGYEDFSGILDRFFSNFQQFISVSVFKILHLRDSLVMQPIGFLSFITAIVLIIFIIMSYKRNKYIFFAGLYLIVLCGGIFAGIQANNKQDRLMLIAMPFIFMVLIYGLYQLTIKSSVSRFFFFCFLVILLFINLSKSIFAEKKKDEMDGAIRNFSVLQKNMKGDIYYGYTDDWVNYLRMSAWCADSLPPSSLVAARKYSMSFIYGKGKEFYPVFVVFSTNPDTILAKFKQDKVTHIIVASLRQNPRINSGQVINTMQRLLYPITQKYPQILTLVKQIGDSEPAYLYKFNY